MQLTLDHQIQANAEAVLEETVRRHGARAASAIVMDPHTGAILAMATAPGFNANRFPTTRADRRRNRAVTDTYEPGSTFKLVTVTAGLQEGIVSPSSAFSLPPTLQVADRVIRESHSRGTERMSVREIVERSSNIGTITIAQRLGEGRLASWIERFGFGKTTGIDFPGESPGFALPRDEWSGSTIGTVPIGHGIAVTPIQMARAYSAVANGGVLVRPRLIERVDGKAVGQRRGARIVSREVSTKMLSMLRGVVVEGTGTEAAIPGYTVAGQDRHRGEDRPGRPLFTLALRRVVRRARPGDEAAARDHGHGRRAERVDLRRRGGSSRVQADRALQPPASRSSSGHPRADRNPLNADSDRAKDETGPLCGPGDPFCGFRHLSSARVPLALSAQ